jgi:hypothetical protein
VPGRSTRSLAVNQGSTVARRRDFEKDRRDHLPKDVPTDLINDSAPNHPRAKVSKPPILREIANQVRLLSDSLKLTAPKNLLQMARNLETIVNTYMVTKGWGTTETMNARTLIERVRSSVTPPKGPTLPQRLPGPGPKPSRRRITLATATKRGGRKRRLAAKVLGD